MAITNIRIIRKPATYAIICNYRSKKIFLCWKQVLNEVLIYEAKVTTEKKKKLNLILIYPQSIHSRVKRT